MLIQILCSIPIILLICAGFAFIRSGDNYFKMLDEEFDQMDRELEKEFDKIDKEFDREFNEMDKELDKEFEGL